MLTSMSKFQGGMWSDCIAELSLSSFVVFLAAAIFAVVENTFAIVLDGLGRILITTKGAQLMLSLLIRYLCNNVI